MEDSEDGLVVVLENYGDKTAVLRAGVAYLNFVAIRCYTGIVLGVAGEDGGRVYDCVGAPQVEDQPPAAALPSALIGGCVDAAAATATATDDVGELLRRELEVFGHGAPAGGGGG